MERDIIYLAAVVLWIFVILITVVIVFGEDEWPRWRRKPFEWIVDDRLAINRVSAQILRRYRHGTRKLLLRARSPPLEAYRS